MKLDKQILFFSCLLVFCLFASVMLAQGGYGDDLVLYLDFDEGEGTTAYDSSVTGNDATLTASQWATGVFDGWCLYTPSAIYATVPVNWSATFPDGMTFSFWAKGTSTMYVCGRWNNTNGFGIYEDGNWYLGNGVSWNTVPHGVLGDSAWHLYTLTYDNSGNKIYSYRDGSQLGNSSCGELDFTYSGNFFIGKDGYGNGNYQGQLDEFRLYDRYMNDTEVAGLYLYDPTPTPAPTVTPVSSSSPTPAVVTPTPLPNLDFELTGLEAFAGAVILCCAFCFMLILVLTRRK